MAFLAKIKQAASKLKTRIFGSSSRADFVAGRTNEAHYFDKWGREWFLYRDPKNPTETAYRVVKNNKVIKEGHTPNLAALDAQGMPEQPKQAVKQVPKPVQVTKPIIGRIKAQETGIEIRQKMINFGQKYQIDSKALEKIKKMSTSALEQMYIWGEILFEAYYNYETLEEGPYGAYAGDVKNGEVWELITAYEEKFGVL